MSRIGLDRLDTIAAALLTLAVLLDAPALTAAPPSTRPVVRAGTEVSAYRDTDATNVLTPVVYGGVESPTDDWGVHGSFDVDVVSAASVDIVATASRRWTEVRYAPALDGHLRVGDTDVAARGSLSREPDYLSLSAGSTVSVDLLSKTVTPSLSYDLARDTSGRSGTSFDVFSHGITRHSVGLGLGLVLDPATALITTATGAFEIGDSSKPYRFIPLFDAGVAAGQVHAGLSIDDVNRLRLGERALEQLPTNRQRWALSGLLLHRFSRSTLRVDERVYLDSWGLKATTTDVRYLLDLGSDLRVWPYVHVHAQTGVDFWKLSYAATETPTGFRLPALRTGDRELGPLLTPTLGLGGRYQLGARRSWSVSLTGEASNTWFLDHLFISERLAFLGVTTVEASFE